MGADAALPAGLWERIQSMIDTSVAKLLKSGLLRNASISEGGLTIRGGFLSLQAPGASQGTFYVGGVSPNLPDGSQQPGLILRREDGTIAMALYDGSPAVDYKQFLAIYDRAGNIILGDDTDSGQGIARPYLPGPFYPARAQDYPKTSATAFETIWRARIPKQQPRLLVTVWSGVDVGSTGEVRVMVNGVQLGATFSPVAGTIAGTNFGPEAVAGTHLSTLTIEVQARVASGAGQVQVGIDRCEGRQS